MPDKKHARNAKARAAQQQKAGNLTKKEKQRIDRKADKVSTSRPCTIPSDGRPARVQQQVDEQGHPALRQWLPGFAVVTHVGRVSGRHYQTPVNMFRRAATTCSR